MERGTVLSGVNDNPHRFNGEYRDWERGHGNTGEYYLRARSYNPLTGRMTQPDPHWSIANMQENPNAIHQAANLYAYTMNNPIMYVDPSGLSASNALLSNLFSRTPSELREAGITFSTTGNSNTGLSIASITMGGVTVRSNGSVSISSSGNWGSSGGSGSSSGYSSISNPLSAIIYAIGRMDNWLDEVLNAINTSNASRSTTTDHGHFSVTSSAFQFHPSIRLDGVPLYIGAAAYLGGISVSPNNLPDNVNLSAGIRLGSGTANASAIPPLGVWREVGGSLFSGYISGSAPLWILPVNVSVSLEGRLGAQYGAHIKRGENANGQFEIGVGASNKFTSWSISISPRR